MMIRALLCSAALTGLIACQPTLPESGTSAFDQSAQARRDAALAGPVTQPTVPAAPPVTAAPLGSNPASAPLPGAVTAAVTGVDPSEEAAAARAAALNSGVAPVQADPANAAAISSEQDFNSVSSRRTIQSDAQRIAANRAQYTVIAPTALPTRAGTDQPNIVAYALATTHPVGAQLYRRSSLRADRQRAACAAFPSPDQAQIDFLERGGPQKDRKGLDPDGDGFACTWDPTPFRAARQSVAPTPTVTAAQTAVPTATTATIPAPGVSAPSSVIVPPLVISSE